MKKHNIGTPAPLNTLTSTEHKGPIQIAYFTSDRKITWSFLRAVRPSYNNLLIDRFLSTDYYYERGTPQDG